MDPPQQGQPGVVVVGTAPLLEDVLNGASTEKPFDLDSFMAFARSNLFAETLQFLTEVDKLRREPDAREFESNLASILNEFVRVGSPSEVNLGETLRRETEKTAGAVLEVLAEDPTAEPDRTCLDKAYNGIMRLIRTDQYARYTAYIVVQRQLHVSRLDALWWTQKGLTLGKFCTFPSPVNSAESRLHGCLGTINVVAAVLETCLLDTAWIWLYVSYGYLARFLCGPRLDPQAFFVLFVLRPLVADRLGLLKNEFTAGSPKRFAQFVGLLFAVGSTVTAFMEMRMAMLFAAISLFGASFLAGFCDLCIACTVFMAAVKANLVPLSACEDCKVRYIMGKGTHLDGNGNTTTSTITTTTACKVSGKESRIGGAIDSSSSGHTAARSTSEQSFAGNPFCATAADFEVAWPPSRVENHHDMVQPALGYNSRQCYDNDRTFMVDLP